MPLLRFDMRWPSSPHFEDAMEVRICRTLLGRLHGAGWLLFTNWKSRASGDEEAPSTAGGEGKSEHPHAPGLSNSPQIEATIKHGERYGFPGYQTGMVYADGYKAGLIAGAAMFRLPQENASD